MQSTAQSIAPRTVRLGLFALAGLLAGAIDAHANYPHNRVRVNVSFHVQVHNEQVPQPSFPWWVYFPQDPHVPPVGSHFPNWPTSFPPPGPTGGTVGAPPTNLVSQPGAPMPFRPASYRAPTGISFDR